MEIGKIKENLVKVTIFIVNLALMAGGVFYFKNQDQKKKEVQIREEEVYNEKIAREEARQLQEAAEVERINKEEIIAKKLAELEAQKEADAIAAAAMEKEEVLVPVISEKINGDCGIADSSKKRSNPKCDGKAPKNGLCSAGIASAVVHKPNKYKVGWNWTCNGENGGTSATCRCS